MPKGIRRDYDELLQAVMHCNGDLSVMAKSLGITVASAQNHIYRYAELKEIYMAQRQGLKGEKSAPKVVINEAAEAASEEEIVLSESQKRVLDDIDASGRGDWANADEVPTTLLIKLQDWGLVVAKKEEGHWFAKLTDDGEMALIGGGFTPKEKEQTVLKPAVGKPTNEPKKKGGWNNKPNPVPQWTEFELVREEAPEQPINPVIGQEIPTVKQNGHHAEDCVECAECLHREVLEYLMERNPDVKELYGHLSAKKKAEREMQAILKKFGG